MLDSGPALKIADDDVRFAALGRPRRVWAVAAINGEQPRLSALHDRLGPLWRAGDRLIYLGNYLGGGGDGGAVIDELLMFRRALLALPGMKSDDIIFLRGQQEEMWQKLLQLQFAREPVGVLMWMLERGAAEAIRAYGGEVEQGIRAARDGAVALTRWTAGLREAMRRRPGHDRLFSVLRRAAYTEGEPRILFVHAGLNPAKSLNAQGDAFWWDSAGFNKLNGPALGFARIIRGHDPQDGGAREVGAAATIDAGSGKGGPLACVCFGPDGAILDAFSV